MSKCRYIRYIGEYSYHSECCGFTYNPYINYCDSDTQSVKNGICPRCEREIELHNEENKKICD